MKCMQVLSSINCSDFHLAFVRVDSAPSYIIGCTTVFCVASSINILIMYIGPFLSCLKCTILLRFRNFMVNFFSCSIDYVSSVGLLLIHGSIDYFFCIVEFPLVSSSYAMFLIITLILCFIVVPSMMASLA